MAHCRWSRRDYNSPGLGRAAAPREVTATLNILAAVQSIFENMVSCEDTSQQQLHFLQSCGFGGLWRFAGPFTKSNCNAENVELFVNCLEALVETCLPQDEAEHELNQYPSMLSVSSIAVSANIKLSSSLTSISLASPTERAANNPF